MKLRYLTEDRIAVRRPPTWGRGLKLHRHCLLVRRILSPPHVGAWIETSNVRILDGGVYVAPPRGGVD